MKSLKKKFIKNQATRKAISGCNNTVTNNGTAQQLFFDIAGNNNQIVIGINTHIRRGIFYLRGNGHKIQIGENCQFGEVEFWLEDNNCSIFIDERVTIQQAKLAVTEPSSILTIEEDCMISNNVEIRTGDSHNIIDLKTGTRINKAENVTLKKHVWIGAHVKILKGVTIQENSIIGTASVVTHSVAANSVAVGIPAKVVRSGITWERSRTYS